jgi:hypothetical protein
MHELNNTAINISLINRSIQFAGYFSQYFLTINKEENSKKKVEAICGIKKSSNILCTKPLKLIYVVLASNKIRKVKNFRGILPLEISSNANRTTTNQYDLTTKLNIINCGVKR